MKLRNSIVLFALFSAGCTTAPVAPHPAINLLAHQTTYQGTLPCADCVGIANTLVLYRDQNNNPSRYQLTETYQGGKEELTVVDRGDWKIVPDRLKQSLGLDEVFVLSPDDPNSRRLFLHAKQGTIELLDLDGNRIDSKLNYTLTQEK